MINHDGPHSDDYDVIQPIHRKSFGIASLGDILFLNGVGPLAGRAIVHHFRITIKRNGRLILFGIAIPHELSGFVEVFLQVTSYPLWPAARRRIS